MARVTNCRPSISIKAPRVFLDVQDEMVSEDSVMSCVPCEPTGSSFLTPGSLPILLPIPGPPQSHSITFIQEELRIVSTRTSFMISPISLYPYLHWSPF